MNLYDELENQRIVEEVQKNFGIADAWIFCKIQAHLFRTENKQPFDVGFYQHLWWSKKAEELSATLIKNKSK